MRISDQRSYGIGHRRETAVAARASGRLAACTLLTGRQAGTGLGLSYSCRMTPELIAAIAAGALALIGLMGIVLPILPGSLAIGIGALVWAIWGGSSWGWVAFGVAAVLLIIGGLSSWLLTGRSLQRHEVPKWPVVVGITLGVVGLFVLPGLGLPIGFVVGLFLAEWYRLRDLRKAVTTSWATVKALGLGILVELSCAMVAVAVVAISIGTAW